MDAGQIGKRFDKGTSKMRSMLIKLKGRDMNQKATLKLSESIDMPMIGFGTYLLSDEDAETCVSNAITVGYRHLDTAEGYANERGVGKAINKAIASQEVERKSLFVTTKFWPGNPAWGDAPKTFETTIESCNASLERLQLSYIDLYLIHAPFDRENRLEQWRALIELKRQGKVLAIGVSNYREPHIEEISSAGLPLPEVNQIEIHPWSQKPELVSYLKKHSIQVIAYSSLLPLSTWRIEEGQDSAKTETMNQDSAKTDSPFKKMAEKYAVSEAQVLLRWGVQNGYAVLPKSVSEERMRQNLDLPTFEIDENDMTEITLMDRGEGLAWSHGDPSEAA